MLPRREEISTEKPDNDIQTRILYTTRKSYGVVATILPVREEVNLSKADNDI